MKDQNTIQTRVVFRWRNHETHRIILFPYFVVVSFSFLLFASCAVQQKKAIIPAGLIPADTMVSLLVDIHLSDAYLSQNRMPQNITNRSVFYAGITKKYGYDRVLFDSTIRFLASNPRLYEEIYDEVINQLSLLEGQVEKEKKMLESDSTRDTFSYSKSSNQAADEYYEEEMRMDSITKANLDAAKDRFKHLKEKRRKKVKE